MTTLALIGLPLADSWNMHDGWGWGWMMPMMFGMALLWGAILLSFVWFVRGGFAPRQQRSEETALTILDRRFAEGALSRDDYHQRRNLLTGGKARRPDTGVRSPASESPER